MKYLKKVLQKIKRVKLNGMIHDFSVDHSSIKIDDILNIHEYLMVKKHMKQCLDLLKRYLSYY